MAVWVKICGITCLEDAQAAFDAGADAIGLNFVSGPRKITVASANGIIEAIPDDRVVVCLVTLGPNGVEPVIGKWLETHGVRHVQVYGNVSASNVRRLMDRGYRVLMVCRPGAGDLRGSLEGAVGGLASDDLFALVLDAHAPGQDGGTGRTLDWNVLAQARERGELDGFPPIVLAGGLTPENVGLAIGIVRPWGADISSGVESSPGRKNHRAMADFVRAAKNAG